MGIFSKIFKKKKREKNSSGHFCSVIIPAAGASSRMGEEDKLFMTLAGMPVLIRTLLAVESSDKVDEIIVVARSERIDEIAFLCQKWGINKVAKIISGGETRTESVHIGTFAVSKDADIIAVHDGARPLVTCSVIDAAIDAAIRFNAAAPAVPVKDTVKTAHGGVVTGTPDRKTLFAVQTPQAFNADIFKAAMENALKSELELTDDCMAVEAINVKVRLTEGSFGNIKITTPEDIPMAEAILASGGHSA
ncbi:MAG: 2-C-methyl-D-erythritol 4-phosphate cytidylyltransferase [Oscillospiraceae bacterium]|nr:2-C-methyl-D-erythritol 4-phosphate cytidylyltransferase [Oscillospiraceae bacterium]